MNYFLTSGAYTLMMDGTEDGNGLEMEAVLLRYWAGLQVAEHVIDIKPAFDRSAKGLMALLEETLTENSISFNGLTSDCFDGASVNSGWKGKSKSGILSITQIELKMDQLQSLIV